MIDYMFRPIFIRPSSGLAWCSKEEQCSSVGCKVHYVLDLGFVENEISFCQGGDIKKCRWLIIIIIIIMCIDYLPIFFN